MAEADRSAPVDEKEASLPTPSMADLVAARIGARMGEMPFGIDEIASTFNMTARTLQRRLRTEGVRFGELRDAIRHVRACELLREKGMTIAAVANRLGFSDAANFHHAFHRWEGLSPGAWRQREHGMTDPQAGD